MFLDFLNGRLPAMPDMAINSVHVDDVAQGHLLAMERGRPGQRYLLCGDNTTTHQALSIVARMTGLSPPGRIPRPVAVASCALVEFLYSRPFGAPTVASLANARFLYRRMHFSNRRARDELGASFRPLEQTLAETVRWFIDNGYVRQSRLARIVRP
jgi:dihydroflavonol-4-reductase